MPYTPSSLIEDIVGAEMFIAQGAMAALSLKMNCQRRDRTKSLRAAHGPLCVFTHRFDDKIKSTLLIS